ncbi:hypothetical protein [Nonomuraea aurantiaca]|uniref:hypothetical protein n=1 Tax=Nonomuraea aurantiaca TaxID=2878562 RepID=UPI001CD9309F|nr:hypothetical protein [Nonomuraea aurantiaca]MCA2224879.1 hypothetical protein [Nonomuraea aurantiaca]
MTSRRSGSSPPGSSTPLPRSSCADRGSAYRTPRRHRCRLDELGALLPRYEELLAESGADALSAPELARLTHDADRLERALRHSLLSARSAFSHLDSAAS